MLQRPLNRYPPALPPQAMQTYTVATPMRTHFEFATCAQVSCPPYLYGWSTSVDESTAEGQGQAARLRRGGRPYRESRDEGGLTVFRFPAGTPCFHAPPARAAGRPVLDVLAQLADPRVADRWHRRKVDRPPLLLLRDGDHRGNPRGTKPVQFRGVRQFLDDFGEHQQRLADRMKRG